MRADSDHSETQNSNSIPRTNASLSYTYNLKRSFALQIQLAKASKPTRKKLDDLELHDPLIIGLGQLSANIYTKLNSETIYLPSDNVEAKVSLSRRIKILTS